ncbi:MAG TPA: hypothetical protein VF274_10700 [Alphaproteobacteria bacterium]
MRPQSLNPHTRAHPFRTEFELRQAKPGETIALLSDFAARREYVGASSAADMLGANVYQM